MTQAIQHIRKMKGVVVSDRMIKTRVVELTRMKLLSKYEKRFLQTKRVKAHDEKNEYKTGDKVVIQESRPLSKDKRWVIIGKQ